MAYVDSSIVFGDKIKNSGFEEKLKATFEFTDMAPFNLGLFFEFRVDEILPFQPAPVLEIAEGANFLSGKHTKYPLPLYHPLKRALA